MSLDARAFNIACKENANLNERTNKLFKQLGLPLKDKVQMDHYGRLYLFGVAVNKKNTNDEIIRIIQSTPEKSLGGQIGFYGEWYEH